MVDRIELAVKYIWTLLGREIPYTWGGQNPFIGWDCSGFVVEVLRAVGVMAANQDWSSATMFREYPECHGAMAGALAFYHRGGQPGVIVHVGFCLDDTFMVEWGGGSATVSGAWESAKAGAFGRVRPIMSRNNLAGFRDPFWEFR